MPAGFFGQDDDGILYAAGLKVGNESAAGTTFDRVRKVTVAVDPADLDTLLTAETEVTIAGVATTDFVVAMPPALATGLVYGGCRVSAADKVQVRLANVTAAAINAASADWVFLIFETA